MLARSKEKANKIPLDNVEIAIDLYPNCGSLGGIFTGLTHAKQQWAFIVACDMPFINIKLIQKMIELRENNDAVVPYLNNFPEPTHALYSKNCLPYIERYLKQNELKISNFFRDINMKKVTREIIEKYDPDSLSLFNINNQKELNSAKQILRNKSKS